MRSGLTEIVLVLDRSGSMESIRSDAEGGVRAFINEQRKQPGEARLTFYRFDDSIERVFEDRSLYGVHDSDLRLEPRGMTALLDAVGKSVNEVGSRLAARLEGDRPEHVVFIIVTDGIENHSREFSKERVRELIERQRGTYKWNFIFIGSTEAALSTAAEIAIPISSTLRNNVTGRSYGSTYAALGANVSAMRSGGGAQSLNFTAQQRSSVLDEDEQSEVLISSGITSGGISNSGIAPQS